jgi:vitamin B12 transporter
VLQGADLRARGLTSVADALREVPGVAIARSGSFQGVTSVFTRGGQSGYTKILIDGVPMNQPGGFFDWSTLSTDNVERIEVVRGPSSVVWGSDAVTGVVNVITRSGRGGPRMMASARAGTYGTVDGEAQLSHASMAATYSLGLAHHRSNGIYAFNNGNGSTVFSGRADAALDEKTDGSFALRYSDNVARYPTDGSGNAVDSNSFSTSSQLALNARLRRIVTSKLSVQGAIAASSHDGGTDNAAGQGSTSFSQTLDHITRRSAEVRGVATLGGTSVATLGAHIEELGQRQHSQSTFGASVFTATRHNRAAFGELVNTTSRTTATLGARVDDSEAFGTFGTFRLAAQGDIAGSARVRASAGTAFREPAFNEQFTTSPAFSRGNPNLKPEHTTSWEVGLSYGDAARIQATYFDQRFVDLIEYQGAAVDPAPNYENVAKALAKGIEVELHHPPVHGVLFDASVTQVDTKVIEASSAAATSGISEGRALIRRPRLSGSARIGFVGIARLRTDVAVSYTGERDDIDFNTFTRDTLPDFALVDVSGEYTLPTSVGRPTLALTFRAANLLDQPYSSVAGYKAPGRTLLAGVRISY